MTLNVNTIGDNPFQPGVRAVTYIPDQLIAGNLKIVSQPIVLGAGKLPRGSVLGQISSNSVVVTSGMNAGNGTVTAVSTSAGVKIGNYTLKATSPTEFSVTDLEGTALPPATVGTAYSEDGINFTITAGATPFAAGDTFSLDVEDSIGTFILSVKTAADGSRNPCAILADFADASLGPVTTGAYLMAEVNANALNFDPSWTVQALTTALRTSSIFVKSSVSAADPL